MYILDINKYLYIYIYMYIHSYVHTYILCIYTYIDIDIYIYINISIHKFTYTYRSPFQTNPCDITSPAVAVQGDPEADCESQGPAKKGE